MAITLDAAGLVAALRLGDSAEELAEVTRLLAYASEAVTKHVPTAPDAVHNEAIRRLAGYLYDQPEAARGDAYANALRNSGAARMMLPYRVHRAGYADAVDAAQAAVGTPGNPVTGLAVVGGQLVVTFADGSTSGLDLPAGMGGQGLPVGTAVLRLGWAQHQNATEAVFTRADNHPTDGAAVGTVDGLDVPPFPPALVTDADLYLHIWIGTAAANITDVLLSGGGGTLIGSISSGADFTVEGDAGTFYVSNQRLSPGLAAFQISAEVAGAGDGGNGNGEAGTDQTARDAATAAQASADAAQSTADTATGAITAVGARVDTVEQAAADAATAADAAQTTADANAVTIGQNSGTLGGVASQAFDAETTANANSLAITAALARITALETAPPSGGQPAAFEAKLTGETALTDSIATILSLAASNFTAGAKYRVTSNLYCRAIGATVHNLDGYLYGGTAQLLSGETVVDPEGSTQARFSMNLDTLYTMPDPAVAITLRAKEGTGDTIISRSPSSLIVMEVL